ncbi:MAG: hypothetical protein AAB803_01040 [Patescibacteria group bacterium]
MHRRKKPLRHSHKHKNLLFLALGIVAAVILSREAGFRSFLLHLGSLGYVGAFISGALFVMTPTIAIGGVSLAILSHQLPLLPLGLMAGAGAVASDLIIFHWVRHHDLAQEVAPLYNHFGGRHLTRLLHTRYFRWSLPVIGALIIASPLPDELGVTLLGISKMGRMNFMVLSFLLNSVGIMTAIQLLRGVVV